MEAETLKKDFSSKNKSEVINLEKPINEEKID